MERWKRSRVKLVREAVEAEDEWFEAFFDAKWPRLFRAFIPLTGNAQEAEDLTRGAFLRLLERWNALDHGTDLQGYLFRTALNSYRSLYRRSRLAAERVLAPGQAGPDPFSRSPNARLRYVCSSSPSANGPRSC